MDFNYTNEKNAQVILFLLKAHNIKYVIASPGTTNTALVSSMQQDPFFKMYSSVDERSAAYMACGLAEELGEPVVISCTGATASRNYLPGLTEAYYRKLPVLAITSMQNFNRVGHLFAQTIDRSNMPKDSIKLSVSLPIVKDDEDVWECEIKVNQAILELRRNGGGPVHINLPTTYSKPYSTKFLPNYRVINRITPFDHFPNIEYKRIAIFIGSHGEWCDSEKLALEQFCEAYNAVVFCDHTSGYKGKYRVLMSLTAAQSLLDLETLKPDLLIHIGNVSGDYSTLNMRGKEVWRVSKDGEIRDTFRRLRYIFEMPESVFFERYNSMAASRRSLNRRISKLKGSYYSQLDTQLKHIRSNIKELPFSNIWLASKIAHQLPTNSVIHFGILNSLRSWNFFELPESVRSTSNVGGFGIDGGLSSLIGASLANPNQLYFSVIGDLAFFYDLNVLGNRHVGNNIRILLVNNGKGTEFRQYNHHAAYFGEYADKYVAAAGHFGNQSPNLVKNFATNLGYEYLTASTKEEFEGCYKRFVSSEQLDKSIIFEVFTDSDKESEALEIMQTLVSSPKIKAKAILKETLGKDTIKSIKNLLNK